jgi:hypothetical protein
VNVKLIGVSIDKANMNRTTLTDIEYHAARVLLLIAQCGSPISTPATKGRTLLAKLDFFLRYPNYLSKAALIRTGKEVGELLGEEIKDYERDNVETRMIRYKYGPWDNIYYPVLAYLIAKNLINVDVRQEVEYFTLTDEGKNVAEQISELQAFQVLALRASLLKKLFPRWNGTSVKEFIYENFPEVVSLPIGKEIV